MTVAVVLFTSDPRLYDHPPLHAALNAADQWFPCSSATPPSMRTASTCPPHCLPRR